MRSSAAARRYARALFALAREESRVEEVRAELARFASLFESDAGLRHALFRPLHPVAERRAVLREIAQRLGASSSVRNFFAFLVDQRRLVEFEGIRAEYELLADLAAGRTTAAIVTATPLSDAQQARLRQALSARTGGNVELDIQVDASLIGGVIASVGALVFDGSLRTQLSQLRASLTKGN